ncbi:MAG: cadherin domain-containing protein, partial [Bacteroidales bacterium]|nr:cadherin domain-containing protein [Bacteroidales bacterium]
MKKLSLLVLKLFFISALLNGQITQLDLIKLSNTHIITELRDSMWLYGELLTDTWEQSVWKSADGKKWELVKDGEQQINWGGAGAAFKGKLYSIGGHQGSSMVNTVSVSEYGKTWTTYNAPFPGRKKLASLVHNNKLFVIAGGGHNDAWYTENGTDWIQATNKISDDFPHFWRPKVVSLNNKLILFGGSKTDWGFVENERGVYISEDDGKNWTRHEFPFPISLDVPMYFVHNNKLWIVARDNPNSAYGDQNYFGTGYKLYVSADGINWKESANSELPVLKNNNVICKAFTFKNRVHSYAKRGGGGNMPVFHAGFTEPEIYLDNISSTIKYESDANTFTIPFSYKHNDASNTNPITFSVKSSDNSIVPCGCVAVGGNNISVTKTGKPGRTTINIEATDGVSTNAVQFDILVFPDAKVYLSGKKSYLMQKGEDKKGILIRYLSMPGYGTNSFSVTSSDNSFINGSEVSLREHIVIKGMYYVNLGSSFNTSAEGNADITITATDGTNSFDFKLRVEVREGVNAIPTVNGTLDNYVINQGDAFNYKLPAGFITDADNDKIIYSSDNLPCGLIIDENTGAITGQTDEVLPFSINIIAKDIYDANVKTVLNVVTPGGNTNSAPDNITLTKSSVAENVPVGTEVAVISATDPDSGDVITYSLDNTSVFKIDNNRLLTNAELNFELKNSYTVKITATDNNSASTIKAFNINVTDVNESPANINITNREVDDNVAVGFEV